MRRLMLIMLGLMLGLATGCPDDDDDIVPDSGIVADSGTDEDAGVDGGVDTGVARRLERPPILPRPPEGGLPADLRPPR